MILRALYINLIYQELIFLCHNLFHILLILILSNYLTHIYLVNIFSTTPTNRARGRKSNCKALHFLLVGEPQLSLALSLIATDFIFACTLQVPSTKTATKERGTSTKPTQLHKEGWWEPEGRECRCRIARACWGGTPTPQRHTW